MSDFDDDDFNDEEGRVWTRFWNKHFDGEPLWYIVAMAAVPLHVGLLISRLHGADALLPWLMGFMVTCGILMLWNSLRRPG